MPQLHIFLPIKPPTKTAQQKRIFKTKSGKLAFFKDKVMQQDETNLIGLLERHIPEHVINTPIKVSYEFTFPWKKTESKKNLALGRIPKITKPDCDNMVKGLQDILTNLVFWRDDCLVYDLHVTKYYGDRPGIDILIEY